MVLFLFHRDFISCCAKIFNIRARSSDLTNTQLSHKTRRKTKRRITSHINREIQLIFDFPAFDQFVKTCTFCSQIVNQIHPGLSLSLLPLSLLLSMNLYAFDDINIHVKLVHSVFKSTIIYLRMYLNVYQRMTRFDIRNEKNSRTKLETES